VSACSKRWYYTKSAGSSSAKRWGGGPKLGSSGEEDDLGVQVTRTAGVDLDPLRSAFISLHFFSLFPKLIWHLGLDTQLECASYGE
jgi:hypothetical protein